MVLRLLAKQETRVQFPSDALGGNMEHHLYLMYRGSNHPVYVDIYKNKKKCYDVKYTFRGGTTFEEEWTEEIFQRFLDEGIIRKAYSINWTEEFILEKTKKKGKIK